MFFFLHIAADCGLLFLIYYFFRQGFNLEKELRRDRIREIAARVFAKNGFERTTIRGIAQEGGISAASIYYYFDSKEDLLYQILEDTMTTGLKLIQDIEKSDSNLKEQLIEILHVHTLNAINFDKMKLLVHEQNCLKPLHKEALKTKQKEYLAELTMVFTALKNSGQMRDFNPKVCAFAFFGMVSWAYRWFNPSGDLSTQELAQTFARIFTQGIFLDSEGTD